MRFAPPSSGPTSARRSPTASTSFERVDDALREAQVLHRLREAAVLDHEGAVARHAREHHAHRILDVHVVEARHVEAALHARRSSRRRVVSPAASSRLSGSGPYGLGAGSAWPVFGTPSLAAQYESVTGPRTTPASTSGTRRFGLPSKSKVEADRLGAKCVVGDA